MSEIVAYLANAFLYAALAVYFWRTRWVPAGPRALQPIAPRAAEHYAVLVPLALHALLLGRAARSLLFGVEAAEPVALVGAAVVLTVIMLGAAYVPARRASRVDPMVALRYE